MAIQMLLFAADENLNYNIVRVAAKAKDGYKYCPHSRCRPFRQR